MKSGLITQSPTGFWRFVEPESRILLVEPQALVREGLRLVLETRPGYVVVGEADDGQKAVELA